MKKWGTLVNRTILFSMLIPLTLMAYHDSDLDGVADEHDLCPNSSLTDIVNQEGCTIEKLTLPKSQTQDHFDLIMGLNQTTTTYQNDTQLSQTLQLDYYHNRITATLQTLHYQEDGMGDTTISLFYQLPEYGQLRVRMGASVILPTYDTAWNNNQTDYRLLASMQYPIQKLNLFAGGSYTFIGDEDINTTRTQLKLQNNHNYYLGLGGYFIPKLYSSLIYSNTSSIYQEGETIKTLSLFGYYMINTHWFTQFGYTQGISDNASDQLNLSVGYYF